MGNIDLSKAVNKNTQGKITGRKSFENINVLEDLDANTGIINKINGVNLKRLQQEAFYVDEEATLPLLNFHEMRGIYEKKF